MRWGPFLGYVLFFALFYCVVFVFLSNARAEDNLCNGGRFAPCICHCQVPKTVQYRPKQPGCRGNAAVILSGKYRRVFSVVVRDSENRDRWPPSGINGCTSGDVEQGLSKCSAFKVQKVLKRKGRSIHCLGAPGKSQLFKDVTRITAKLRDVPGSSNDPLVRWCLKSPKVALN